MMKFFFYRLIRFLLLILKNISNSDLVNELFLKCENRLQLINFKNKNVTVGTDSIIINTTFSSSTKGDQFFIGSNCTITGCVMLGHDASPTVFLSELSVLDKAWLPGARRSFRKPIVVGNNVFIGHGTILLPGVHIGDNVVVAAGSVVTSDLDSDAVYGGNPAKFIKNIEAYTEKYRKLYLEHPELF